MGSSIRLYRKRLSEGNCGGCGHRPHRDGHTTCDMCSDRHSKRYRKNRGPMVRDRTTITVDPTVGTRTSAKYRSKDPKKCNESNRISVRRLRLFVIDKYGGVCTCCGEFRFEFLTLHHVNNDGAAHRKEIGSKAIYLWAKRNNFPNRLTVLCMNCNWSIGKFGGCPHRKEEFFDESIFNEIRQEAAEVGRSYASLV